MLEEEFICWHKGQNETDGKEIKAPTIEAAAKKAVDVWRHENVQPLHGNNVTVYVRDSDEHIHEIIVSPSGERNTPEAFH